MWRIRGIIVLWDEEIRRIPHIRLIKYSEGKCRSSTDEKHPEEYNRDDRAISPEVSLCPVEVTSEAVDMVSVSKDGYPETHEHESREKLHTEVSKD